MTNAIAELISRKGADTGNAGEGFSNVPNFPLSFDKKVALEKTCCP